MPLGNSNNNTPLHPLWCNWDGPHQHHPNPLRRRFPSSRPANFLSTKFPTSSPLQNDQETWKGSRVYPMTFNSPKPWWHSGQLNFWGNSSINSRGTEKKNPKPGGLRTAKWIVEMHRKKGVVKCSTSGKVKLPVWSTSKALKRDLGWERMHASTHSGPAKRVDFQFLP